MSGISEGNIYSGVAQGINQGVSGALQLYGMNQKQELGKKNLEIHQQNADNYSMMLKMSAASKFEKDFDPHFWHQQNLDTAGQDDGTLGRAPGSGGNLRVPGGAYTPDQSLLSGAALLKRS